MVYYYLNIFGEEWRKDNNCLICEHFHLGRVPDFILEKIPAMLGIDGLCATPSLEGFEEGEYETPGEYKRKRRQSVGGKWQSHFMEVE